MSSIKIAQTDSSKIQQTKQQQKIAQKQQTVSFFDEKWSGYQISRLTGDNAFTDWLQDKDKVCTDGKDDGKIGLWEGAKSFAKGLIGGIPKAIINHPVATAVAVGLGVAATIATSGAILPVLGAIGVATGVGMAGYGGYKAASAKTDGEAKQALETLGLGVTTTALSVAAADKALEKAAEAGVKSAQVSEDAGIIEKTVQMFKAIPEALKESSIKFKANTGIMYNKLGETETQSLDRVRHEYMKDYLEDINPDVLNKLEQSLKARGIETVVEHYSQNGTMMYHGKGVVQPIGYKDPCLIVKYNGKEYLIKTYNGGGTPIELKEHFIQILEGKKDYQSLIIRESHAMDMSSQFKNPFWAVTDGATEPTIDILASKQIRLTGSNGTTYYFYHLDKPITVQMSLERSIQFDSNKGDTSWLIDFFEGKTVKGVKKIN